MLLCPGSLCSQLSNFVAVGNHDTLRHPKAYYLLTRHSGLKNITTNRRHEHDTKAVMGDPS